MSERMAGTRDGSWYNYPRHDWNRDAGWTVRYHVEDDEHDGTPACNPNRALLLDLRPLSEVPVDMRCNRPACRKRWAEAEPHPKGQR